jgi:hypothetical protein
MELDNQIANRPDHFPGEGLPLMLAPWEGHSQNSLSITGVGYSSLEGGADEAAARNAALADAQKRTHTMMGDRRFFLMEDQSYAATSDTDFGIKILYLIQMH